MMPSIVEKTGSSLANEQCTGAATTREYQTPVNLVKQIFLRCFFTVRSVILHAFKRGV